MIAERDFDKTAVEFPKPEEKEAMEEVIDVGEWEEFL